MSTCTTIVELNFIIVVKYVHYTCTYIFCNMHVSITAVCSLHKLSILDKRWRSTIEMCSALVVWPLYDHISTPAWLLSDRPVATSAWPLCDLRVTAAWPPHSVAGRRAPEVASGRPRRRVVPAVTAAGVPAVTAAVVPVVAQVARGAALPASVPLLVWEARGGRGGAPPPLSRRPVRR